MDVMTIVKETLSLHFGKEIHDVAPDDSLDWIGVDSTGLIDLLLDLERKCGVEFDMDRLEEADLRSVGTLVDYIRSLRKE